ncbi:TIMP3 [Branchiostoma lanceolatum]|uniref:TIMP3 protein n=1 Tax=Branchiostoma lanceolatum TaxID=7740 RepID=A0A8K0A285_BRALA|nr:TIMP3 [Branchiostoma lanceolatum]
MARFWAVLFLTLAAVHGALSCTCMPAHPQTIFCHAEVAVRGKIVKVEEIGYVRPTPNVTMEEEEEEEYLDPSINEIPLEMRAMAEEAYHIEWVRYTLRVTKVFKGAEKMEFINKNKNLVYIYTMPDGAACGIKLNPKQHYLLTGHVHEGRFQVGACGWNVEWSQVTVKQRRGLKYMYGKHCEHCSIQTCFFGGYGCDETSPKSCVWKGLLDGWPYDCHTVHSACIRKRHGSCEWFHPPSLRKCEERAFPVAREGFHEPAEGYPDSDPGEKDPLSEHPEELPGLPELEDDDFPTSFPEFPEHLFP